MIDYFENHAYTRVPDSLLDHWQDMGLTRTERDFLIFLLRFTYHPEREKWCWRSIDNLAKPMGCSERTISRAIKSLKVHELLNPIQRKGRTYVFDLTPLFEMLVRLEEAITWKQKAESTHDTDDYTSPTRVSSPLDTSVTPLMTSVSPKEDTVKKILKGNPLKNGDFNLNEIVNDITDSKTQDSSHLSQLQEKADYFRSTIPKRCDEWEAIPEKRLEELRVSARDGLIETGYSPAEIDCVDRATDGVVLHLLESTGWNVAQAIDLCKKITQKEVELNV